MIRSEIIRDIAPILRDQLVVCNIGLPSQELHMIDDQASTFYMLGTMGLSSSIGLGVALAQQKTVISIDVLDLFFLFQRSQWLCSLYLLYAFTSLCSLKMF